MEYKKMKKIVFWKSTYTQATGHGKPLKPDIADALVEWGNKNCPDIYHKAVDADLTKFEDISDYGYRRRLALLNY